MKHSLNVFSLELSCLQIYLGMPLSTPFTLQQIEQLRMRVHRLIFIIFCSFKKSFKVM